MSLIYRVLKGILHLVKSAMPSEVTNAVQRRIAARVKLELKQELKDELKNELKQEVSDELVRQLNLKLGDALAKVVYAQAACTVVANGFLSRIKAVVAADSPQIGKAKVLAQLSEEWRSIVRKTAGLAPTFTVDVEDLISEVLFLKTNANLLRPVFAALANKRVLYSGQAYYNAWYLSRALRIHGWKADVLNWDANPTNQIYYHGEDFKVGSAGLSTTAECLEFYVAALYGYDVFHFSNAHGISFGYDIDALMVQKFALHLDIHLLKSLGKKIVYSNNGCLDGVSQTSFAKWGPESVCNICIWKNNPSVCSDEKNLSWGIFRNEVADYQCLLGGNRVDFNDDPRVHELPEFYCLDSSFWLPDLLIPDAFKLPDAKGAVRLYHAVGHKADRTSDDGVNIKSSHIYLPLIKHLRADGLQLELIEPTGIPNKEVRYLQAQADIFLDMLTFGWFGANAREAMMLGKPVICYIRPEWLASLREELPEYADELPIISATPTTVEGTLRELIANAEMRREVGVRSRAFAVKWHSADAAGIRFDDIYSRLLQGDALLRQAGNRVVQ